MRFHSTTTVIWCVMTRVEIIWLEPGRRLLWTLGPGIAMAMLIATGAFGHDSWINKRHLVDPQSRQWCCDEHDCEPLKTGVKENGAGYIIAETGEDIPYARVIWKSEDGLWWRCRNLKDNSTRCLIGPPPGS